MTDQSSGNLRMIDNLTAFRGGQGVGYESSLAWLRGDIAPLDGGQGLFAWDQNDFSTLDDGVNVIVDVSGRRWKRANPVAAVNTWAVIPSSATPVQLTGTTAESTLATVTVPAGAMGENGAVRWKAIYSFTNGVNTKRIVTRFGGAGGDIYSDNTFTTANSFTDEREIRNRNSVSSQVGFSPVGDGSGEGAAVVTSARNTANAQDIVFRAQLGNAADTITLESYIVEIVRTIPPPPPLPPPPPIPPGTVTLVVEVETIADMKELPPGAANGVYVRELGSGGMFTWNSTSTAAEDGDGVFIPDPAPASGRWLRGIFASKYAARRVIDARLYGAIGDGNSHPVSEWLVTPPPWKSTAYANLAAIQADYPHVDNLSNESDWAAIQLSFNRLGVPGAIYGRTVYIPNPAVSYRIGSKTLQLGDGAPPVYSTIHNCTVIFGDGSGISDPDGYGDGPGGLPQPEGGCVIRGDSSACVLRIKGPMGGLRTVGVPIIDQNFSCPRGVLLTDVGNSNIDGFFCVRLPTAATGIEWSSDWTSGSPSSHSGVNRVGLLQVLGHHNPRCRCVVLDGSDAVPAGFTESTIDQIVCTFSRNGSAGLVLGFTDHNLIRKLLAIAGGNSRARKIFQADDPLTVDLTNNRFNIASHWLVNDDRVLYYAGDVLGAAGTNIGGLTSGNIYFVVNAATHTFQLSATPGGAVIDLTSLGSSSPGNRHTITRVLDASSAAVVDTLANAITWASHGFVEGQRVYYNHGGGTAIGGLTSGGRYDNVSRYYVRNPTANTFQLSASNTLGVIDLTALGVGAQHVIDSVPAGILIETTSVPFDFPQGNVIDQCHTGVDCGIDTDPSGGGEGSVRGTLHINNLEMHNGGLVPGSAAAGVQYRVIGRDFEPNRDGRWGGSRWFRQKVDAVALFDGGYWLTADLPGSLGYIEAGGYVTTDAQVLGSITRGTNSDVHIHALGGISFQPGAGAPSDARTARLSTTDFEVASAFIKTANTELTIAGGVVTATRSFHSIDTEADAATDNLDAINGAADGRLLIVRAQDDARTVVLKHNTGNLRLPGGADFSLDSTLDTAVFVGVGSLWMAISTASNHP